MESVNQSVSYIYCETEGNIIQFYGLNKRIAQTRNSTCNSVPQQKQTSIKLHKPLNHYTYEVLHSWTSHGQSVWEHCTKHTHTQHNTLLAT